jgi:hypothetical protein
VVLEQAVSAGRTTAAVGPAVISSGNFAVSSGSVTVPVSAMNAANGYHLVITPGSSPAFAGAVQIKNVHSGLVLGTQASGTAQGTLAVQAAASGWGNNGTSDHLWQVVAQGSGQYKIVNYNSGLVLGVQGESTDRGVAGVVAAVHAQPHALIVIEAEAERGAVRQRVADGPPQRSVQVLALGQEHRVRGRAARLVPGLDNPGFQRVKIDQARQGARGNRLPPADHRQEGVLQAQVGIAPLLGDLHAPHLHVDFARQESGRKRGRIARAADDGEHRRLDAVRISQGRDDVHRPPAVMEHPQEQVLRPGDLAPEHPRDLGGPAPDLAVKRIG